MWRHGLPSKVVCQHPQSTELGGLQIPETLATAPHCSRLWESSKMELHKLHGVHSSCKCFIEQDSQSGFAGARGQSNQNRSRRQRCKSLAQSDMAPWRSCALEGTAGSGAGAFIITTSASCHLVLTYTAKIGQHAATVKSVHLERMLWRAKKCKTQLR